MGSGSLSMDPMKVKAVDELAGEMLELKTVMPVLAGDAKASETVEKLATVVDNAIVEVEEAMEERDETGSGD